MRKKLVLTQRKVFPDTFMDAISEPETRPYDLFHRVIFFFPPSDLYIILLCMVYNIYNITGKKKKDF